MSGATADIVRALARQGEVWRIEPHVCAACFGRIASSQPGEAERVYRCTNCGSSGAAMAKSICCCGMKYGARDAGVRCIPNPDRRPEMMNEIVVREGAA